MTFVLFVIPLIITQKTSFFSHAGTAIFNTCIQPPVGLTQQQLQQLAQQKHVLWCSQTGNATPQTSDGSSISQEVVSVDFGKILHPASQSANGILLTLSGNDTTNIRALKPKFFRTQEPQIYQNNYYQNIKNVGGTVQLVVYADYFTNYASKGVWPGDNNDWTTWETSVSQTVSSIKQHGYSIEWDIWNEPDIYQFWQRDQARYYETWRRAYKIIKQSDPNAIIVGPSMGIYNQTFLQNFLLYAKQNNVLPSIISWHELDGTVKASQIETRINTLKQWMSQNGINISKIDINEILGPTDQYNPGVIVHYFGALERLQVNASAKACWNESNGTSNCWNDSFDGLLTPDTKQTRSSWWAYNAYSNMTGTVVQFTPSYDIDGVATIDNVHSNASILLGRQEGSANQVVVIVNNANQLSFLAKNNRVGVIIQKIPDTETSPLLQLPQSLTFDSQIYNNQILLALSNLNSSDAYKITFSQPSSQILPAIANPQVNQFCDGSGVHMAQISWNLSGRINQSFAVDIDNDGNLSNGYWKKIVGYGTLSTTGPDGFTNWNGSAGPLVLSPGKTYYSDVYFALTNEASPVTKFTVPTTCPSFTPTTVPPPINLLQESWTSNALDGWMFYYAPADNSPSYTNYFQNNVLNVNVSNPTQAVQNYRLSLYHDNVNLVQGKKYQISVTIAAVNTSAINIGLQTGTTYLTGINKTLFGNNWNTYTFEYTSPVNQSVRLQLSIGSVDGLISIGTIKVTQE